MPLPPLFPVPILDAISEENVCATSRNVFGVLCLHIPSPQPQATTRRFEALGFKVASFGGWLWTPAAQPRALTRGAAP